MSSSSQKSSNEDDQIDLPNLYSKSDITHLYEEVLNQPIDVLWKAAWLHGDGYGDFLKYEGDLEVEYKEWEPLSGNGLVHEDIAKLKYDYHRAFSYAHPRTTMLMFGPKNAPAMQTHYLYLLAATEDGANGSGIDANSRPDPFLSSCRVRKGLIMTVTQFDGIPMADAFKVVQYWSFDSLIPSREKGPLVSSSNSCMVRVGVNVFFVKSTMFKSQVRSGVKDELVILAKRWCAFISKRMQMYSTPSSAGGALLDEDRVDHGVHARRMSRSLLRRPSTAEEKIDVSGSGERGVKSERNINTYTFTTISEISTYLVVALVPVFSLFIWMLSSRLSYKINQISVSLLAMQQAQNDERLANFSVLLKSTLEDIISAHKSRMLSNFSVDTSCSTIKSSCVSSLISG